MSTATVTLSSVFTNKALKSMRTLPHDYVIKEKYFSKREIQIWIVKKWSGYRMESFVVDIQTGKGIFCKHYEEAEVVREELEMLEF